MEKHKEILNNINNRYVLVKDNQYYHIVDKLRRTLVFFNDPIINIDKLIEIMIENKVEIYNTFNDLPEITEFPINMEVQVPTFQAFIRKVFNKEGNETGAIITGFTNSMIRRNEKLRIEQVMQHYAFHVLYPNEGLNLYSCIHDDTASISVIRNINNLPSEDINEKELYNW